MPEGDDEGAGVHVGQVRLEEAILILDVGEEQLLRVQRNDVDSAAEEVSRVVGSTEASSIGDHEVLHLVVARARHERRQGRRVQRLVHPLIPHGEVVVGVRQIPGNDETVGGRRRVGRRHARADGR